MTTFLVGVDGSEGARKAAFFAAERARMEEARLLLAHVVERTVYYTPMMPEEVTMVPVEPHHLTMSAMEHVLQPLKEAFAGEDLEIELLVRHGHAADRLNELAREYRVDQVFTGRRGRSRVAAMFFGSVSRELVQSCPVPITVVPDRSFPEEHSRSDVDAGVSRERSGVPGRG